MDRKMVNFIREQYPPGTRIRLNSMEDPYAPILPGTEGEVDFVDDAGQLHMKWDNGRSLALIPGEDSFTVLPPKLTTLKLYMPLTADLYERNEYGEFDDCSTLLEGSELWGCQDQITAALLKNRMPEETERGLMHWYDEVDSVNTKVRTAVFTVEERDRQLWGVAECRVAGELSDTELETLKEYLTEQASDGWGEGFEQRDFLVDGGSELYVHLWNSDEWSIQTEQELFAPKLAEGLPEMCFSTLPGTGELICIKRGESGYYPSDWNTDNPAQNRELADYNNERLGVTQEQRLAMECGSMHGRGVPGADPKTYERDGMKMGGMTLGYHVVDAADDAQLGRFYAENDFVPELEGISDEVFEMLDFAKIGKVLRTGEGGVYVSGCYVVLDGGLLTAPPCPKELPEKPGYLFQLTLGLHPDFRDNRTAMLNLPALEEDLEEVQEQLGTLQWKNTVVLDYDGIIPNAATFADLPMEMEAFNEFTKAVKDIPARQVQLPKLKALLEQFEVRDIGTAISLTERLDDYVLTPEISSPQETAIDQLHFMTDDHSTELLISHVNLYAYGCDIIKEDNAVLSPYGLLHRADYQPMLSPVQQSQEMEMKMK